MYLPYGVPYYGNRPWEGASRKKKAEKRDKGSGGSELSSKPKAASISPKDRAGVKDGFFLKKRFRGPGICYECGKDGHYAKDC